MSNKTVKSKLKPPGCNNLEISLPLLTTQRAAALLSQLIEKSVKLRQTKSKQKIKKCKAKVKTENLKRKTENSSFSVEKLENQKLGKIVKSR